MATLAPWLSIVTSLGWAELSRAEPSACRATAEVRPSAAVVGQQLLYRVRIVRRQDVEKVDWVRGLSFPGFRVEWLPGHAEDTQMQYRGMTFVARAEDRALFPTHAGVFEIPEASLRCTIRGRGPEPPRSEIVRVAPVRVRVVDPPTEGRPDDFAGAVGPLWIQTSVGAQEMHLGESISVSILVRGAANLWDLPRPLGAHAIDAELFWKPPGIDLEAGERLYLRRYFRFDIVPRKTGPLMIPAIRVPYYDSRTGHYEVAEAKAITLDVLPRANAQHSGPSRTNTQQAQSDARKRSAAGTRVEGDSRFTGWIAAGALPLSFLAIAVTAGAVRRHRNWTATREALAEAEQAREANDARAEAAALSRALYAAVAVAAPNLDSPWPSPKTLREHAATVQDNDLVTAADAIDALDRARFRAQANAGQSNDARAAIHQLRTRSPWRRRH